MRQRHLTLTVVGALAACLLVPQSAIANDEPGTRLPTLSDVRDEARLVPSGSRLGAQEGDSPDGMSPNASTGVKQSPAGCVGYTDYPHSSNGKVATTSGPYASVHGRTKCNSNVTTVTARAEVWKKVWHGNHRLLVGDLASRKNNRNSGDSTPHYNCKGTGKAWYVGITNHSSLEGGTWYTARSIEYGTQNKSEFTC